MRQEEKKISSWRDLTMKQLALLMRDYAVDEQDEVREEWNELLELIKDDEKKMAEKIAENSKDKNYTSKDQYITWVAVYFLAFVAVYHSRLSSVNAVEGVEKVEEIIKYFHLYPILGLDKPKVKYPSKLFSEFQVQFGYFFSYSSALQTFPVLLEDLRYIESAPSIQKTVGNIFDRLMERHKKEVGRMPKEEYKDGQWREIPYGRFIKCLDSWNVGQLWANYQKYQEIQDNPFARKAEKRLRNGIRQLIFTGAPGTGKTYIAKLIAGYMGARLPMTEKVEEGAYYTLVQFHPSYDYTDFVEGLRPVRIKDQNAVNFVKLDGQFKTFCRMVAEANVEDAKQGVKWEDKKYFFLIDEINRAELSKVFGELMYGLEADKRGPENRMQTQYQNLPAYNLQNQEFRTKEKDIFWDGFFIPSNVIVIGTMNEIDRSAESMDFALRRRFEFMEAVVSEKTLEEAFRNFGGVLADNRKELAKSVNSLNKEGLEGLGRKYNLDRQYFISQGQFANLPADEAATLKGVKNYVWEYRVKHLLREYLRGEPEDSIREFVDACRDKFFQSGEYDPQYSDEEP